MATQCYGYIVETSAHDGCNLVYVLIDGNQWLITTYCGGLLLSQHCDPVAAANRENHWLALCTGIRSNARDAARGALQGCQPETLARDASISAEP